jgi:hypothetical protein
MAVGYSGKWYERFGNSSIGSICKTCATTMPWPPKWSADARCAHFGDCERRFHAMVSAHFI